MSQKAINETIGTGGLVPTLVYGSMPRFRAAGLDARLQANSERFLCMDTARAEYTGIVNHQHVQQLLRTRVPPGADRHLHIGQHVFVSRKGAKVLRTFCDTQFVRERYTSYVECGSWPKEWRFLCRLCPPEMADVFLARISSTLSSYSNRAPGSVHERRSGCPSLCDRGCGEQGPSFQWA
jgi:hypothetical protein